MDESDCHDANFGMNYSIYGVALPSAGMLLYYLDVIII